VVNLKGSPMTAYALDNAFYAARTKAATPAKKADADGMQAAQRQLGHASLRMTEHYVRLGDKVTPTARESVPQT